MWEMCASAGISASSRLSVNSSKQFWKVSSEARLLSIFLEFFFLWIAPVSGCGFVTSLWCWTWTCTWRVLRWPRGGRTGTLIWRQSRDNRKYEISRICRESASLVWSSVAFDRWSTQRFIRVLRRVFLVIELQACPRGFAPSLRDHDRDRVLVFPRCVDFSTGPYHLSGSPGFPQSIQFLWAQILSSQQVHWRSGVNHEFQFFWR